MALNIPKVGVEVQNAVRFSVEKNRGYKYKRY